VASLVILEINNNDLKTFYCCVIRSTLEYSAQVWNGNLMQAQRNDIERVQKRALRIIVPEYEYNRALQECELKTLQERRDDLCVHLVSFWTFLLIQLGLELRLGVGVGFGLVT
jgi:hypothetical protein